MLPRQVLGRDRLGLNTLLLGPTCTAVWGLVADGIPREGWEGVVGHALEPSYLYLEGTLTFNEWNVFRRASLSVCGQTICLTSLSESVGSIEVLPDGFFLTD